MEAVRQAIHRLLCIACSLNTGLFFRVPFILGQLLLGILARCSQFHKTLGGTTDYWTILGGSTLNVIQDRGIQQVLWQNKRQADRRGGVMSLGLGLEQGFWKGGRGRGNRLIDERVTMRPVPSPAFSGHMRMQRRGVSALHRYLFVPTQAARIIVTFCQLGKLPIVCRQFPIQYNATA